MTNEEIEALFIPLWGNLDADFIWLLQHRPLLSHYTSIDVVERILENNEIWLSNPLFMNDMEELRFGMVEGRKLFQESDAIQKLCGSQERFHVMTHYFHYYFNLYDQEHAIDTYVLCFSEHNPENTDGLLSMWRGYGGHGNGAALVFNTNFVTGLHPTSPLIVTRVSYASRQNRLLWLQQKFAEWCMPFMGKAITEDKLYLIALQMFNLVKLFSLTHKHDGFQEEREWRIIYMPDRDPLGVLKERFGYFIGSRGVEPKLKLQIEPLPLEPRDTWTFATILDRIILGPSVSSPLARSSVVRMLTTMGKAEFVPKVVSSTIPLRPL